MNKFVVLALLVLGATAQNMTGHLNCTGATGPEFDSWCDASCNNDPPECPRSLCTCEGDVPSDRECTAVGTFSQIPIADSWCELNCNHDPPFCPTGFCSCENTTLPDPTLVDMGVHEPTCCDNEIRHIFYSDAGHIYKRRVGAADSELCYELPGGNPTSLIVDANDYLWVADPILGVVLKMSTSCNASSVQVIQSWARDQFIDKPTALAFFQGGLIVSGSTNVFYITFTAEGVHEVELVNWNNGLVDYQFFVRDIEVRGDRVFLISRDARVIVIDNNGQTTLLDFHDWNIVDYGGITINDCGLYFTDSDSNQIWYCPEMNTTLCRVYCEQDEDLGNPTCVNTNNPTAISSGCCCDIYVSNPGNGCVTKITNDGFTTGPGPHVPEIIACNLTHPNAFTFWVEPGSPANCAQECNPDPPSPSASPSPSPSPVARQTGRLVPGVNMQFAGGVTTAAVLTGMVTVQMIKCPPGVDLTGLTDAEKGLACPADIDNTYKIPITQLKIVSQDGTRVEDFQPFLTASTNNGAQPVCMLHTEVVLNTGGVLETCDNACIAAKSGVANAIDCTAVNVDAADAQARTRLAATARVGSTVTTSELPETAFQSASNSLCEGESMVEFSVNLMDMPLGTPVRVNAIAQPRFDFADRCSDSPGEVAPRMCYLTSEFPANVAVHGSFGDADDFVCTDEFLLNGTEVDVFEFDEDLEVLQGDILDQAFGVQGRAQGCPLGMQNAPFNQLCYSQGGAGTTVDHRICLQDNCP